jgi:hypothetical protein
MLMSAIVSSCWHSRPHAPRVRPAAAGLQPVHLDPYGLCPLPSRHPHVRSLAELARILERTGPVGLA